MLAGKHDITIEQGSTFQLFFIWLDTSGNPIDLTGYSAVMKIKPYLGGSDIDSLASGAEITLGAANGTVQVDLTATVTAAYSFLRAKYDLEVLPAASAAAAIRLLEGDVTLSKEVTV
ncbi:MAG: hypothetical protein ACXABY_19805 [Candidatus Thorarchaeota archaeon]|jgi:hypothetical protein